MQLVRESASQYNSPDYFLGYGIPDLQLAVTLSEIEEEERVLITVFPNPAHGNLNIVTSRHENTISMEMFDFLGKKVYSKTQENTNTRFDITNINDGIYIARIKIGSYLKMVKIVKH